MRPCPQHGCFGGHLCCFDLSDFLYLWPTDPRNVFLVVCFYESFKSYHFSLQRNDVQLSFPIHLSCIYIKCHWLYIIRIISVIEICSFENIKIVTTHQSGVEEGKGDEHSGCKCWVLNGDQQALVDLVNSVRGDWLRAITTNSDGGFILDQAPC